LQVVAQRSARAQVPSDALAPICAWAPFADSPAPQANCIPSRLCPKQIVSQADARSYSKSPPTIKSDSLPHVPRPQIDMAHIHYLHGDSFGNQVCCVRPNPNPKP